MKQKVISIIIKVLIAALSALAGALGVSSMS